ncbi:hypothetical protein M8C13_21250 [Crossiella sp. SN42]|uniref:hypothetical protein n=1 Tax=Crossiella sp. SN42 TaxID=2944808 RepID=UPI00207D55C7|nr:hypothetical protein [Crossiella sp. SN42]MCO1578283.1 hypothetical protein [Crossiella sp. SN42]
MTHGYPGQQAPGYPQTGPQPMPGGHPGQPYPPQQPGFPPGPGPHTGGHPAPGPHTGQQPAVPGPPPGLPAPGQSGPVATGPWAERAAKPASFLRLVAVEFRKLVGTRSDKIVLAFSPVFLVGVLCLIILPQYYLRSASDQIMPNLLGVQLGQLLLFVAVIKLIAGEWQYKSVQPTLLVQPSRLRYLLAQASVLVGVWLLATLVTFIAGPLLVKTRTAMNLQSNWLGMRPGWTLGVIALATALVLLSAMVIGTLIPNTAAAITVFFVAVPLLTFARAGLPEVIGMIYPLEAAYAMAGLGVGAVQTIVSVLVWVGLLVFGALVVSRRDAG